MFKKGIKIGGLVYSVSCEDDMKLDSPLEPFCTEENADGLRVADCQLSIVKSKSKIVSQKSKIGNRKCFETDATWGLYELTIDDYQMSNIEYKSKILTVPSLKNGNRVKIFAEFDRDFRNGTVYICKTGWHYLLYPFLEVLTINLLAMDSGVLIHACCVNDNGNGYLFVGQSGAGKSTTAQLWSGINGITILSDDRIIIRKMDNEFFIYGTPWHGDAKICSPEKVSLERIFFLRHAKKNKVKKIDLIDATSRLIVCSFPTFWDKKGMEFTLNFCSELAAKVPCYDLDFLPDKGIIDFIRDG